MKLIYFGIIAGLISISTLCVLCYRLSKGRRKIEIPSAFLFKDLPQKKISQTRTYPPRLFFELLFFSLCSLAIFSLIQEENVEKRLIILDNSHSMSALVKGSNKSRLDRAKELISERLSTQERYKLVTIPQHPISKNQDQYVNKSSILEELKSVSASTLADNLNQDVNRVLSSLSLKPSLISIYTDKILKIENESTIPFEPINVGTINTNIYIERLQLIKDQNAGLRLKITLGLSGSGSTKASLIVSSLKKESKNLKRDISLNQSGFTNFEINLDRDFPGNSIFKIELKDTFHVDAISSDNIAYIYDSGDFKDDLYFISQDKVSEQIIESLKKASFGNVRKLSPEEYSRLSNLSGLSLFYKTKFPKVIKSPTLMILPAETLDYLQVKKISNNSTITSWNKSDPLTRYISFDTLNIPKTMIFHPTSWAEGVLSQPEGPILLHGIMNSFPVIVSGFELLPFDKGRKSAADILLLNILSELRNETGLDISHNRLHEDKQIKCLTQSINCSDRYRFLEKGVYQIGPASNTEIHVVNNLNQAESNSYQVEEINLNIEFKNNIFVSNEHTELFRWITLFAVGCLTLDVLLLIYFGRELKWRGRAK